VTLFTPLNPAFVAAVREARTNDHLQDALMRGRGGRVLTDLAWEVSTFTCYSSSAHDKKHMQRLAIAIGYDGEIFAEVE